MQPSNKISTCCKTNQVSALERKLQKRNEQVVGLQKQMSGRITHSASESIEANVIERITETDTPRKISRKLSHAGQAVTETEMEMDSLTAEIDSLKQQLEEVMMQSRVCILSHEIRLLATQLTHIEMNSALPHGRRSCDLIYLLSYLHIKLSACSFVRITCGT